MSYIIHCTPHCSPQLNTFHSTCLLLLHVTSCLDTPPPPPPHTHTHTHTLPFTTHTLFQWRKSRLLLLQLQYISNCMCLLFSFMHSQSEMTFAADLALSNNLVTRLFVLLCPQPEMIGHYLGEFSITYKPVKHGRPGIGATHSSRFIPLK